MDHESIDEITQQCGCVVLVLEEDEPIPERGEDDAVKEWAVRDGRLGDGRPEGGRKLVVWVVALVAHVITDELNSL